MAREVVLVLSGATGLACVLALMLNSCTASRADSVSAERVQSEVGWQCWAIKQDGQVKGGNCVPVKY